MANSSVGERLKIVRDREGLGTRAFGDATGVSKQTVLNYEEGGPVPHEYLRAVCKGYEVNPAWLLLGPPHEMEVTPPEEAQERLRLVRMAVDTDDVSALVRLLDSLAPD